MKLINKAILAKLCEGLCSVCGEKKVLMYSAWVIERYQVKKIYSCEDCVSIINRIEKA